MTLSLEIAKWLTVWAQSEAGRELLAGLPVDRAGLAAAVPRLRKRGLTPEQTSATVELAELRQRAKVKFADAERLFLTRRGYEQASGQTLAAWKADCLRRQWPSESLLLVDLCCGVGGDLREFARVFPSLGVELDPAVAHFAAENLRSLEGSSGQGPQPRAVVCAAVETLLTGKAMSEGEDRGPRSASIVGPGHVTTAGSMGHWPPAARDWVGQHGLGLRRLVWHLDPDRRDASGRHTRWEDLCPGPEVVSNLCDQWGPGVVKLAPATEIPEAWGRRGHWQWMGWARECKQLLGWFGLEPQFPAGQRSVVVWDRESEGWRVWPADFSKVTAGVKAGVAREPAAYLFEPQAAVYAAGLTEALALELGWRRLAGGDYFTADAVSPIQGELFAAFQVLEVLPLRLPTIRAWLDQRSAVVTEVKSRLVAEKDASGLRGWVGRSCGEGDGLSVSLLLYAGGSSPAGGRSGGNSRGAGAALRVAVCRRVPDLRAADPELPDLDLPETT